MTIYQPISYTTTPVTLKQNWQSDSVISLDRAAGITLTLPAATGDGTKFEITVGTAASGGSYVIQVANSSDTMAGVCITAQDGGDTVNAFEALAASDTITMNGTTTGGLKGDKWVIVSTKATLWNVQGVMAATGTEATPFSAAV